MHSFYPDQVVEAAFLHSKANCYFIGPFAKRVSFTSQQHRAIDLITALNHKGRLGNKVNPVAVIGAGLAGLTATACLRGLGYKVHLYEAEAKPLWRQKSARHRLVHPTISRWPMQQLSHTTHFPFLDWFAAPGDVVVKTLLAEWDQWLKPADGDDKQTYDFRDKHEVLSLVHPIDGSKDELIGLKVKLDIKDRYEAVILTTGFGTESGIKGLMNESYWDEDQICRWSEAELAEARRGTRPVLVSGCGDGGLIDCLRLIHGHFDEGWLTVALAELLDDPSCKDLVETVINAEHVASMAAKSVACMPKTKPKAGPMPLAEQQYIRKLRDAYMAVADGLPPAAKALLDDSIKAAGTQTDMVRLISKEIAPYVPYSAPIHKIMIAHAIKGQYVTYVSGSLGRKKGAVQIFLENDSERPVDPITIVRYGAPPQLVGPVLDNEATSLRIRQLMLADYIELGTKDHPKEIEAPSPPNYPTTPEAFTASRFDMANALIKSLIPTLRIKATKSGFSYLLLHDPGLPKPRFKFKRPERLFGLDVPPTATDVAEYDLMLG